MMWFVYECDKWYKVSKDITPEQIDKF